MVEYKGVIVLDVLIYGCKWMYLVGVGWFFFKDGV